MSQLKRLRERRNLTQRQLADASGVSQQMISAIESNRRTNPGIETVFALADALDCEVFDLYPGTGKNITLSEARIEGHHDACIVFCNADGRSCAVCRGGGEGCARDADGAVGACAAHLHAVHERDGVHDLTEVRNDPVQDVQ